MYRARFRANEDDPRPVKWPIKHPWWCTGYGIAYDEGYSVIVAYVDDRSYLLEHWPEATNIVLGVLKKQESILHNVYK